MVLVPLLILVVGLFWPASPVPVSGASTPLNVNDPTTIERGRYLAVLGNCQGCHTQRGGAAFSGGRGIPTPFGTVYSSNLTPSPSGLGAWSSDDFWRALHHGQSRDGRWLNPAFPYSNTTRITREDSDTLFAFFRSLTAVETPARAHEVPWPFNTQAALGVWRTLYFRQGEATVESGRFIGAASSPDLRRGAYLVNGLGHCSACHVPRNALGGNHDMLSLSGGLIPVQNWYAPSLLDPAEAGLQAWALSDIVALFQNGRSKDSIVTGPMAEVVQHSTQHWKPQDLQAMATYLKQLPHVPVSKRPDNPSTSSHSLSQGGKTYEQHCAQCHGKQGEGVKGIDGAWAYPALAGNHTVRQSSPANLVQSVLNGGFGPSTHGHPRPYGMPPFMLELSDRELSDLLSYVRSEWGNQAAPVSELDVQKLRGSIGP